MRIVPPIIIISGGIIVPPVIGWWFDVFWTVLLVEIGVAAIWFGNEIRTAPTIDELFPPEDISPASHGPEASAVELEPGNITNLNATATHEGEK